MLIVFDVGNSETTIGLFEARRGGGASAPRPALRAHWRITTDVPRTADEYRVLLQALVQGEGVAVDALRAASIGSVVPRVTEPLAAACARLVGGGPVTIVDGGAPLPIRLDVDEPRTVGADRIINTLAASRLFQRDAIVVDLGTATTFDCITADGIFLGGVIAPGVRVMLETLVRRTSKLPATELVVPTRAIGRNTEDCIRAGVMFGAAEAIDGVVRRIKREWPGREVPLVVATGGLAESFRALCAELDRVEPYLTLEGLQMAHEYLVGSTPGASAAPVDPTAAV